MTASAFSVHPTSRYKRLSTKLPKGHRDFEVTEKSAVAMLSADPYNRARRHNIKILEGVPSGDGQYRLRIGRWRFRYDILGQVGTTLLLRPPQRGHVLSAGQCRFGAAGAGIHG